MNRVVAAMDHARPDRLHLSEEIAGLNESARRAIEFSAGPFPETTRALHAPSPAEGTTG